MTAGRQAGFAKNSARGAAVMSDVDPALVTAVARMHNHWNGLVEQHQAAHGVAFSQALSLARTMLSIDEDVLDQALAVTQAYEKGLRTLREQHGAEQVERVVALVRNGEKAPTRFDRRMASPAKWRTQEPPAAEFALPGYKLGTVGLLAGAGAASKSFLSLQSAISIALGLDLWNLWNGAVIKKGPVVFLALEDDEHTIWQRVRDMTRDLRLSDGSEPDAAFWRDFDANFRPVMLYGEDFRLAERDERGNLRATPELDDLVHCCNGARAVFVDTFSKATTGLDENSAGEMGVAMSVLAQVAERTNTAVIVVHHISKDGGFKGSDEGLEIGHIRGSTVLPSNSRSATMMAIMNADIAKIRFQDAWETEVGQWTLRAPVKSNYGPMLPAQWLRKGPHGVLIGFEAPPPRDDAGSTRKAAGKQPKGSENGVNTKKHANGGYPDL
jgi:hypothetical protein